VIIRTVPNDKNRRGIPEGTLTYGVHHACDPCWTVALNYPDGIGNLNTLAQHYPGHVSPGVRLLRPLRY